MQCLEPVRIPLKKDGKIVDYIDVACLHCEACQEKYKDDWAFRCVLELSACPKACMITLTFSEEGLARHNSEYPELVPNSVTKAETDKFLKRLRKDLDCKIRFFGVSEYGEKFTCRPHYHFILYGIDENHPIFDGKIPVYKKGMLHHYYIWNGIEPWSYGEVEVSAGRITAGAIRYMLKYFVKQQNNQSFDLLKGRERLFVTASRKPGLGFYGIQKHLDTLIHQRYAHLGNRKVPLSRYIVQKLEEITDMDIGELIKLDRYEYFLNHPRQKINKKQWLINRSKSKK